MRHLEGGRKEELLVREKLGKQGRNENGELYAEKIGSKRLLLKSEGMEGVRTKGDKVPHLQYLLFLLTLPAHKRYSCITFSYSFLRLPFPLEAQSSWKLLPHIFVLSLLPLQSVPNSAYFHLPSNFPKTLVTAPEQPPQVIATSNLYSCWVG